MYRIVFFVSWCALNCAYGLLSHPYDMEHAVYRDVKEGMPNISAC